MKKRYEDPNLELIRINRGDVVSTSECDEFENCWTDANNHTKDHTQEGQN